MRTISFNIPAAPELYQEFDAVDRYNELVNDEGTPQLGVLLTYYLRSRRAISHGKIELSNVPKLVDDKRPAAYPVLTSALDGLSGEFELKATVFLVGAESRENQHYVVDLMAYRHADYFTVKHKDKTYRLELGKTDLGIATIANDEFINALVTPVGGAR